MGVGSHGCFHLIHSDDSLKITQIYKVSSEYRDKNFTAPQYFMRQRSICHVSVMTSTGSFLLLDLCLRLRRLCERDEGAGQAEAVAVATERERRSVSGCLGIWRSLSADSRGGLRSLSVSWRHLSKQPAVNV